jgi:hypothetical protein
VNEFKLNGFEIFGWQFRDSLYKKKIIEKYYIEKGKIVHPVKDLISHRILRDSLLKISN